MGIIAKERFISRLQGPPDPADATYAVREGMDSIRYQIRSAAMLSQGRVRGQLSRESALEVWDLLKDYVVERGYFSSKTLRPWEIDPLLSSDLDTSEPWWGIEFETGWADHRARSQVVEHVWETWDNVSFDGEGEGDSPVEITFAPQEVSKYLDGTANAYQFAQYMASRTDYMETENEHIGTHINISHPLLTQDNRSNIVRGLNMSIAALPRTAADGVDVRTRYFGRTYLYGGFGGRGRAERPWVEGKLFRTTYRADVFARYMQVFKTLTDLVGILARAQEGRPVTYVPFVTNLLDMLANADATPNIRYAPVNAFPLDVNSARMPEGVLRTPLQTPRRLAEGDLI